MWWLAPEDSERIRADLAKRVAEAQAAYERLPLIERIRHDVAQQTSFIRSGGFEPSDNLTVSVRLSDLEALIKQATGED